MLKIFLWFSCGWTPPVSFLSSAAFYLLLSSRKHTFFTFSPQFLHTWLVWYSQQDRKHCLLLNSFSYPGRPNACRTPPLLFLFSYLSLFSQFNGQSRMIFHLKSWFCLTECYNKIAFIERGHSSAGSAKGSVFCHIYNFILLYSSVPLLELLIWAYSSAGRAYGSHP